MQTAPLKAFATSARTELIREVTARITAVLSQGSPERVENPTAVAALEMAIIAGGGGDEGKAHMADKVAYTWFNRIIALRFMDANGYTGIGVVSPAADQIGQPEVLAAAKRGQIDKEVVSNDRDGAAITGLLSGTRQPRPGVDAQAEAYSLLFAAYCRFWHNAMPFMFERRGDFTELLIPANLLADDSVLNRSVDVLTQDVCKDVEVIGWLYQFYISERKDEVFAGFKKNRKAGADEIPAATQLFTPHWIVRYLVENSVGRLWMLNRPDSSLIDQMDYYIAPVDEETDFLKIARPEDLTVIDPACGSGHMLTYAFDLLYAIYEGEGYTPSEIPGLILSNNIYGTEIDPRAGALAAFALTMKAAARRKLFLKNPVEPNVCVLDPIKFGPDELDLLRPSAAGDEVDAFWNQFQHADTFGSLIRPSADLIAQLRAHVETLEEGVFGADELREAAEKVLNQAEYLSQHYHVAIANPPYMGSKQMNALLSQFMKDEYPTGKGDLMTAFMVRAQELTVRRGTWAMINLPSWMSLKSFEDLRHELLRSQRISSMVHLGRGIFGSDFGTVAFVVDNAPAESARGVYRRLFEQHVDVRSVSAIERLFRDPDYNRFEVSQADLAAIPGAPIVYWLSEKMRGVFTLGRPIREAAEPRKGMDTGDNAHFLRAWWEVSRAGSSLTMFRRGAWVPYNKGGGFRRWYGCREFLLDWRNGGEEMRTRSGSRYFGQEGWTWGTVTSGGLSVRYTPPGAAFDNGGCTLFANADISAAALILNSSTADAILAAISPTLNFQPINIGAVPLVLDEGLTAQAKPAVEALVALARADWDDFETSWDFERNPLVERFGQG